MIQKNKISVKRPPMALPDLGFFRFGRIANKVVLTNDAGEWMLLSEPHFLDLIGGRVNDDHPAFPDLQARGFMRTDLDAESMARKLRRKKSFLQYGPHLHVVVTTLRCNMSCKYCHASRAPMDRVDTDMTLETARKVVDTAMKSTSPTINFEYQGGEPTLNMPVIKFMVQYSRERNRAESKDVVHSVVTNFAAMTEENAQWLIDHDVMICTSLDGPKDLHDANRPLTGGGPSFDHVMHWMKWINQRYIEMGRDPELWHVDALLTTTRGALHREREIIDLYRSLGIRNIHLRPLNPYGFASARWEKIGYSVEEFLDFYARALDIILERNRAGDQMMEGTAAVLLAKMLTPDDPNYVDIRSPCGAGIGQVAYNHDGRVFPCDEGRMVAAMGDDLFSLGNVGEQEMSDLLQHPTVRSMAVASINDALPGCESCWNAPFCGVCPVHAYKTTGDLFGQRPRSALCKTWLSMSTLLMEHLAKDETGDVEKIFRRWTISRARVTSETPCQ